MNVVLKFIKKSYCSYVKNQKKLRFVFLMLFCTLIFAVGVFVGVSIEHNKNNGGNIHNKQNIDGSKIEEDLSNSGDNALQFGEEVKVVIDPGHGGEDLGAVKDDLYEKDLNLDICLKMGKYLEAIDINVVYTREKDIDVGLDERVNIANGIDATLFISVHNNYMPNHSGYMGTETLYCSPLKVDEDKMDGEKLAIIVQNKLANTLKTVDNGVIHRPNLVVLRKTKMPAVIAEVAYMSNSSDRANLLDEEFRNNAAKALAESVMEALDFMKVEKNEEGKWITK